MAEAIQRRMWEAVKGDVCCYCCGWGTSGSGSREGDDVDRSHLLRCGISWCLGLRGQERAVGMRQPGLFLLNEYVWSRRINRSIPRM